MSVAPVPDGFAEIGRKTNAELRKIYGVSEKTIVHWRKECGIKMNGGRHPSEWYESPKVIELCLNCDRPKCSGDCLAVRKAGGSSW